MTKILHTIKGLNIEAGGLTTATYDLVTALNNNGTPTDILSGGKLMYIKEILQDDDFVKVRLFDPRTPLGFSKPMRDFLKTENEYEIYHTNGLWLYINHITCVIARKKRKPYIISPHGMLYPRALARSNYKKWLFNKIWVKKDLRKATCIHCTCEEERQHCRNLGLQNPIAIIPNPVTIPDYINDIITVSNNADYRFSDYKIGFLGRFHPVKKIENLLDAWHSLTLLPPNAQLLLMGQGNENYMNYLREYIKNKKIKQVVFTGQLTGREKYETLASLRALFVPSDFENFGMIVPEALMVETPVMASLGTPWKELNDNKCGWWQENSAENISKIINFCFDNKNENLLRQMGKNGRNLVYEKYSANCIARKMKQLYKGIIEKNFKNLDYVDYI